MLNQTTDGTTAAPGNLDAVFKLAKALMPSDFDGGLRYMHALLSGLAGIESLTFGDDHAAYRSGLLAQLNDQTPAWSALATAVIERQLIVIGGAGNDTLPGNNESNLLYGARGDDTLAGGRGDGHDTMTEEILGGAQDKLLFADVNMADVSLLRDANDVRLLIADGSGSACDGRAVPRTTKWFAD